MIRRALILVALPLGVGLLVAVPAGLVLGERHWSFAAVAFALCVPPGVVTLLLSDYLARVTPYGRLLSLMIGTAVRLTVGLGGAVVILLAVGPKDSEGRVGFLVWVLFAYLLTLAAELVLLARPTPGESAREMK